MTKYTKLFLGLLVILVVFVWTAVVKSPGDRSDNSAHLYFLNVGQGDSELIEKGDYQILIDGGPDDSVLSELGKVMPLTDRKIDVVILTHPHADHMIGINQMLDRYEIGKIYSTGVIFTSNGYDEFLNKIKDKNIEMEVPELNQSYSPFENAKLTFLWPGKKFEGKNAEDNNLNNSSEVAKFCYLDHCALFTGDIETGAQEEMINSYSPDSNSFQSEILKISHHGSSNGTNQKLLDVVAPNNAVIEVGADNKFGHPHASTIELLQNAKIQQYRTDQNGTIEFVINQSGIIKK